MQLLNRIKNNTLKLILTIIVSGLFIGVPTVSASYSRESYGSCAYGQSCPTTVDPGNPITPTNPGTPTTPTVPGTTSPTAPTSSSTPTVPGTTSPVPTPRQSVAPFEKIVLSRKTIWLEKFSPTQQKILPLIFWILLIILAIIILIQSMFDRIRAKQLQAIIHELNILIEDKKSFVRLVMHHLNTPIATIKSATELLESSKATESKALALLNPAILSLSAVAHDVESDTDAEKSAESEVLRTTPEITISNMLSRWYFLLPVMIAIIFGIGASWLIVSSGKSFSFGYWLFSVSFSILSIVILFNALRLWRLGRARNEQFTQIEIIMNQLNEQRQKTIEVLSSTLQSTIYKLSSAKDTIQNATYATFIQNSIDELQLLANKVSVTSRPLTKPEKFNIGSIISSAISRHQQQISDKHLAVKSDIRCPSDLNINTDEIYFMTDSLVDNAVRYNHDQGSVDIHASFKDNKLEIDITDSGEGISSDTKQQLYEPFSKIEGVLTYDQSGMGLSLYASKILASRLGGSIKLTSHEGKGTRAQITLPLLAK